MEPRRPKTRSYRAIKAFVGKTEKICIKCGFVTFCLHVLYKHKFKCRGRLLGQPYVCNFCGKKFDFFILFRTHKRICSSRLTGNFKSKLKLKSNYFKKADKLKSLKNLSKVTSGKKRSKKSQKEHSARKTINNVKKNTKALLLPHEQDYTDPFNLSEYLNISRKTNDIFSCLWCKSSYPSKKLLLMHLERNDKCFAVHYQKNLFIKSSNVSFTARKTVVAKKSFPTRRYDLTDVLSGKRYSINGSARKSTPSSSKLKLSKYKKSFSDSFVSHCPVCYKKFFDNFIFYKHQKRMNHWGRAAKSIGTHCKCPFCGKDFFHVKARNDHVQNHGNKTDEEINAFLNSIMCSICSRSFATISAKQQHMNIEHTREVYSGSSSDLSTPSDSDYSSKHKLSSVPSSVKKKLRNQPNICPVCGKAFSHTVLRNKHFNEAHLKIFECQFCNTKFKSTSSLSNHIQLIHSLECKECKSSFKDEFRLLQHVLISHPNEDPQSFLLSKTFKSIPSKENNQNVNDSSLVAGNDKLYSLNSTFQRNMEFFCDVCDIGYQKLCGLQRHRQSKLHKDTLIRNLDKVHESLSDLPPSPVPYPKTIKQPEILTCSECSDDFTNIKEFVPHRLSHFSVQGKYLKISELNPYMCEICSDVLDSHSKVQLHLFWHLQIESTANNKTNNSKISNKNETIIPDRLSGQHVAKKSFTRPKNETQQEVVIGGVKKPLFTCEYCNIGFTTKSHFNMHIRKLCRKKKSDIELLKAKTIGPSSPFGNESVSHCTDCNFLYCSPAKFDQHKEFCFKREYDSNSEDNLSNIGAVSTAIKFKIAVAGCISCGIIFDDISNITNHMTIHKDSQSDFNDDVVHCAICNCLFSYHAFKLHKEFCNTAVNSGYYISDSKYMNVLRSALELKSAVAGCLSCGLPFDDLQDFSEHLTLHQVRQIQNMDINTSQKQKLVKDTSQNFSSSSAAEKVELDAEDKSEISKLDSKESSLNLEHLEFSSEKSDDNKDLRENFSQLLCLLISDPELMERLGHGKQLVDDVLVNVLRQMGQKPFTNDMASDVECLEKNIQMLLNFCLKDQIMQIIGNGKTTGDMVSEALKILSADESATD